MGQLGATLECNSFIAYHAIRPHFGSRRLLILDSLAAKAKGNQMDSLRRPRPNVPTGWSDPVWVQN